MAKLEIRWEINDGYAGGSRPQYVTFDPDDWTDCAGDWEKLSQVEQEEIEFSIIDDEMRNMGYTILDVVWE